MAELFQGFIQLKGGAGDEAKRPICNWSDPNNWLDKKQANQLPSYAGILRNDVVCIDVDTKESDPSQGRRNYEIINNYITTHKIKCVIIKTTKGWHFYFKRPQSEMPITRHTPAILCCGIKVDYLVSNGYCALKLNGVKREILSNPRELDDLPKPFCVAIADKERQNKYNFYNAGHGERYTAICGFKLVLIKKGYKQEELTECITMACDLFAEKYPPAKIQEICQIKPKEIDKINETENDEETLAKNKRKKQEEKDRQMTRVEASDLGAVLVDKYSITSIDRNFKELYYKPTPNSVYQPVILFGDFDALPWLSGQNSEKVIPHSYYDQIRDKIKERMGVKKREDFNHFICTSDDQVIDTKTLQVVDNKDAIMRVRLNCKYDPNAYSEIMDEGLDNFCNHDTKLRMVIEEIMGQCILPFNDVKKLAICVGEPNCGKTTLIRAVTNMIGEENTTSLNLEDMINDKYLISDLPGKTANIGDEITGTDKITIERLKALTGNSSIVVQKKYKNGFPMKNGAFLWFFCNKLPTFKQIDHALEDRLHVITIPNNNFKKNPNFIDSISDEVSKSYLLNLALKGIQRVRNNGYDFTETVNAMQTKNRYVGKNDILKRFLGNLAEQDIDIYNERKSEDGYGNQITTTTTLYEEFCPYFEYTFGEKYPKWPQKIFTERIKDELRCDSKRVRIPGSELRAYQFSRSVNSLDLRDFAKYSDDNLEKNFNEIELETNDDPEDPNDPDDPNTPPTPPSDPEIPPAPAPTSSAPVTTNSLNSTTFQPINNDGEIYFVIYDFEVFKYNWMVTCNLCYDGKSENYTIIDNREKLTNFYNTYKDAYWVGYNSNNYDLYILKAILNGLNPYEVSQCIIKSQKDDKTTRVYNKFNFGKVCKDLKSFDCSIPNGNVIIGLKELESYLGDSIEETSVDFNIDRPLTDDELEEVKHYNIHDVKETKKVFLNNIKDFKARFDIVKKFNLPPTSISKTKAQLSALILGCKRPDIERNDDTEIEYIPTIQINKYLQVIDFYKSGKWQEEGAQLTIAVNGVPHIFGIGGLHGAIGTIDEQGNANAIPTHRQGNLVKLDVTSFYPSLILRYNWLSRNATHPELYKQIYDERVKLKAEGKKAEQAPLKIVLNATYGITKAKNSEAYDPRQANNICINGQLALLDLLEKLEGHCSLIQSNTDGIIIQLNSKDDLRTIENIKGEWEKRIGVGLEMDLIEEIWQRDVNTYMIKELDKNGAPVYECKGKDLAFNDPSNNDINIVKKAVRDYLTDRVPLETTIKNPNNKLIDYQYTTKYGRTYIGVYYGKTRLKNKYNRVFASIDKNDPTLYKIKKEITINKSAQFEGMEEEKPLGGAKIPNIPKHCFIDNSNINNKEIPAKLDYNWYINEAKKLVERVLGSKYKETKND